MVSGLFFYNKQLNMRRFKLLFLFSLSECIIRPTGQIHGRYLLLYREHVGFRVESGRRQDIFYAAKTISLNGNWKFFIAIPLKEFRRISMKLGSMTAVGFH